MPVNPHTGLYNVTPEEVADALAATEDFPLVREDGTLTPAGQEYVADMRENGHGDCDVCYPEPYDRLCAIVDRIKNDDRSLDTDEYADMILSVLGVTL